MSERRAPLPTTAATETRKSEPTHFGSGWISGVLSITFGAIGLGAVLCFHYPSILTVPSLRGLYPLFYVRALLHLFLVSAFVLGVISVVLRQRKRLGLAGLGLTLAATLLGGSQVPIEGELRGEVFLGLDWFLLNLIGYSLVFIPLERMFARRPEQAILRRGWRTDLVYFFVSALLVQVTTFFTVKPAIVLFQWAGSASLQSLQSLQSGVGGLPFLAQFVAIVLVADLAQYWVHRLFHQVGWLWRFHSIHHSAETMDWLAGSRLHLFDVAVTRGVAYIPVYLLGFAAAPVIAYVAFVSIQATFIHANIRFRFKALEWLLVTPRFHHWHHGAEPEAINKNFAVHLPLFDRLFGTWHLPQGRWPLSYGIEGGVEGEDAPPQHGYLRQFLYPLLPQVKKSGQEDIANRGQQ